MVGHLFGYEAALAIDAGARPLREARAAIEGAVGRRAQAADGETLLEELRPTFEPLAARFFDTLRNGSYDGHLEASTGSRVAALFRYALGTVSSDGSVRLTAGRPGAGEVVASVVDAMLTLVHVEQWTRVRVCPADDCLEAFYDSSRGGTRRWCAMGVCGNRSKVKAYRDRGTTRPAADHWG